MFQYKKQRISCNLSYIIVSGIIVLYIIFHFLSVDRQTNSNAHNGYPSILKSERENPTSSVAKEEIKIMTWNVQGIQRDEDLTARTDAVIRTIRKANVDIVFFQELVSYTHKQICEAFEDYRCVFDGKNNSRHFVGVMFKKTRFALMAQRHVDFAQTNRYLLLVQLSLLRPESNKRNQIEMFLMTSHLQSLPFASQQRIEQLKKCFQIGNSIPKGYNVVFGGDLNLEEGEDNMVVPEEFGDLWVLSGSSEEIKYTWDSTKNSNDKMVQFVPDQVPRTRYDRLYFRNSNPITLEFVNLELLGKEKVEGTNYFPSDHWALLSTFKVL